MRQDIIGLGILSCPQQKKSGNEYDMAEKRGVTVVNGNGGAVFFFLILYIVIRFGVKHGIQDAKKDEERKN